MKRTKPYINGVQVFNLAAPIIIGKQGEINTNTIRFQIFELQSSDLIYKYVFTLPNKASYYSQELSLQTINGQYFIDYDIEAGILTYAGNGLMELMAYKSDNSIVWESESYITKVMPSILSTSPVPDVVPNWIVELQATKNAAVGATEDANQAVLDANTATNSANSAATNATNAANSALTHVNTIGNPHGTTKSDLGLGNVENTSDLAKPISTAQATVNTSVSSSLAAIALQANTNTDLNKSQKVIKPIFIEQFMNTWYGRGMLATESPYSGLSGRTTFAQAYSNYENVINITDASSFVVGSIVAVEYLNGTHFTHFISAITGNTITILPVLQAPVDITSHIERGWNNSAHAGEYTYKYIAEQIANATVDNYGAGTILFELTAEDMVAPYPLRGYYPIGASTIAVNSASSNPFGIYTNPPTTVSGKGAYVVCAGINQGLRCPEFKVTPVSRVTVRGYVRNAAPINIRLVSKSGTILYSYLINSTGNIQKRFVFNVYIPIGITDAHLEFIQSSATNATIYPDDIEVVENIPLGNKYIIPRNAKVVMLYDSWAVVQNTALPTQLQALLPNAQIINKGIGGNAAVNMLDRFDTDVKPYNPDVVICDTGVNDAYGMASNDDTAYIANLMLLIEKCRGIGATPIFIGIPALAEADLTFTAFALNDRARIMSADARRNMQSLKTTTNAINITLTAEALATGSAKSMSIGSIASGKIVTIKMAGGYITTGVKLLIGFATTIDFTLLGSAYGDLSATNYFEKADAVIDNVLNYSIKNNEAGVRFLVIRIVNDSGSNYTGSVIATMEI